MPIDIAVLATTVVTTFLTPYVKVGLEKIAEGAGKKVGEQAGEYAANLTGQLWERVKSAFSSEKDQTVLTLFEENPDEMQGMLVKALRQKLEHDPDLTQTLVGLVNAPGPDGQNTGAQIMNAGIAGILDMRGANLSQTKGLNLAGTMIGNQPLPDDEA